MGGLNCFDKRKERYQMKRSVKGWHRIFYRVIDLAIKNSLILWQVNKRNRSSDLLTFRVTLARQLINGYFSRKRKGRPVSFQAKCTVPDNVRIASVENHLTKIVSNYRQCRECIRKGQEKLECDVPLSIVICLYSLHGR
ncbi:piggyBac transposable element-derived protein 4 [Trichonephila clavipes]|nr:piggyBac transposable element-derived protein 4 [Trichonephila clavipes]